MWDPELAQEARWHARELARAADVVVPASFEQLLQAATLRGIQVFRAPMIAERGISVAYALQPFIQIRDWGDAPALAHELLHILMAERFGGPIHTYPAQGPKTAVERAARLFEWLLTSPSPRARAVLEGKEAIPVPKEAQPVPPPPAPVWDAEGEPSGVPLRVPHPDDPPFVVAYLRTRQGEALEARREACHKWAEERGLDIWSWYVDRDVEDSVWFDDRPAGGELLSRASALRTQGVRVLLVTDPVTIGACAAMRVPFVEQLEAAGLEVRTLAVTFAREDEAWKQEDITVAQQDPRPRGRRRW